MPASVKLKSILKSVKGGWMIILTDGKRKEFNWYLDRETLMRCRERDFRVILYCNGTEYIMKLDGLFIAREEVVQSKQD